MNNVQKPYRGPLQAVILDWAGTTVDHGSLAPIRVLQKVFADRGIEISEEEARRDMGVLKKDHLPRRMLVGDFGSNRRRRMFARSWAEDWQHNRVHTAYAGCASFSCRKAGLRPGLRCMSGRCRGWTSASLDDLCKRHSHESPSPRSCNQSWQHDQRY